MLMPIISGRDEASVDVRSEGKQDCPVCKCKRRFVLVLRYEYAHFYWMFGRVTSRRYFVICDACEYGYEVNREEIEAELVRIPIPFLHRYGCLLWILGFIFLLACGLLAERIGWSP
jgi:hypothetical protein